MRKRISQLEIQAKGVETRLAAKRKELDLVARDIEPTRGLMDKGFATRTALNALLRLEAELEGEYGELVTMEGEIRETIAERRYALTRMEEEARVERLEAWREVRAEISRLNGEMKAVSDRIGRLDVRSPKAGIVHDLGVHAEGAVVSPGERIVEIVPKGRLVVVAKVDLMEIDRIGISDVGFALDDGDVVADAYGLAQLTLVIQDDWLLA